MHHGTYADLGLQLRVDFHSLVASYYAGWPEEPWIADSIVEALAGGERDFSELVGALDELQRLEQWLNSGFQPIDSFPDGTTRSEVSFESGNSQRPPRLSGSFVAVPFGAPAGEPIPTVIPDFKSAAVGSLSAGIAEIDGSPPVNPHFPDTARPFDQADVGSPERGTQWNEGIGDVEQFDSESDRVIDVRSHEIPGGGNPVPDKVAPSNPRGGSPTPDRIDGTPHANRYWEPPPRLPEGTTQPNPANRFEPNVDSILHDGSTSKRSKPAERRGENSLEPTDRSVGLSGHDDVEKGTRVSSLVRANSSRLPTTEIDVSPVATAPGGMRGLRDLASALANESGALEGYPGEEDDESNGIDSAHRHEPSNYPGRAGYSGGSLVSFDSVSRSGIDGTQVTSAGTGRPVASGDDTKGVSRDSTVATEPMNPDEIYSLIVDEIRREFRRFYGG